MGEVMALLRDEAILDAERMRAESLRVTRERELQLRRQSQDTPDGVEVPNDYPGLDDPALMAEVSQWKTQIDADYVHIEETAAVLRSVREEHIKQMTEALELLLEEQKIRRHRCNVLSKEIGRIQNQKIALLSSTAHQAVDGTSSREASQQGLEGVGSSPDGGAKDAKSVLGETGGAGGGGGRSGGAARQKKVVPLNPIVGAGPLTKKEVERHFAAFWAEKSKIRAANQTRHTEV
jgi:hypothetical protein